MKTLDVEGFHSGIDQLLTTLNLHQEQMNNIKTTIEQFVALEDAFKGNGGLAIRTFYRDHHLPFLIFFDGFATD